MKVLFVDDDPVLRHLGSHALGTIGGMSVDTAVDGTDALSIIETSPPDVIVMDVMMPGMDGDVVLAVLQASPTTQHLPVIFLTAVGAAAQQELLKLPGAVACIAKPFDPDTLGKDVAEIVASANVAQTLRS